MTLKKKQIRRLWNEITVIIEKKGANENKKISTYQITNSVATGQKEIV